MGCRELERRLAVEQRRVNATPTAARQLEAKLRRVMREKVELENQLEAEQECIVMKLQKQLRHAQEHNECVSCGSCGWGQRVDAPCVGGRA